jgi:outer membrane lipoprotein-sorting protein
LLAGTVVTRRICVRRMLALAFGACAGLVTTAADALALDELMGALHAIGERHAAFEETREIALLSGPIVRRGELHYRRPDRLEMRVDSPYFERLTISGDQLTIEHRTGASRLALSSQPLLSAWIESLRATLAGDAEVLRSHFQVGLEGTLMGWKLELTPRDPELAEIVTRILISGHDAEPTRFEIQESKGDRTVVAILPRRPR